MKYIFLDSLGCIHDFENIQLIFIAPPGSISSDDLDEKFYVQTTTRLRINIASGGEEYKGILHAEDFSIKGIEYLYRNFMDFTKVIIFPPIPRTVDMNMKPRDIKYKIIEMLESLLNHDDGFRLMLTDYEDCKYFHFIQGDDLPNQFDDCTSHGNRLLLFYSQFSTIVNTRIVDRKDSLHKEMKSCINDLKAFTYTFSSMITDWYVYISCSPVM